MIERHRERLGSGQRPHGIDRITDLVVAPLVAFAQVVQRHVITIRPYTARGGIRRMQRGCELPEVFAFLRARKQGKEQLVSSGLRRSEQASLR